MSHDNVIELPSAATSFITIRKAPRGWNVMLTTPAGPKALSTVLHFAAIVRPPLPRGRTLPRR